MKNLKLIVLTLPMAIAAVFMLASCGGGGDAAAAPSVFLNLSAEKSPPGSPVVLSWISSDASSCAASGSWAGSLQTSGTMSFQSDDGGRFEFVLTCSGKGGAATRTAILTVPMKVWPTSYENKTRIAVPTTAMPNTADPSMQLVHESLPAEEKHLGPRGLAFGDFFQEGSYAVVNFTYRYVGAFPGNNPDKWADAPGMIVFLRRGPDGRWRNDTSLLVPNEEDRRTCISSSYTIVADFNNDKKPDIYAACTGIDFTLDGQWRDNDSEQFVFLSRPDGKYERRVLPVGKIYGHQATAGDIDGDGNVDIVTTDVSGQRAPFVMWGNGDGTFRPDKARMPSDLSGRNIYGAMLIPIDGRLRLFLSGVQTASFPDPKPHESHSYGTKMLAYSDGAFRDVLDLTDNLPLTTEGRPFNLALDHVYRNGYLYSFHVSYDYWEETIIKTDLKTLANSVVYRNRSKTYGKTLVLFNINPSNQIEVYGSICNVYDGSHDGICALKIQL